MLALRDRNSDRHVGCLWRLVFLRLDVHEFEQLEAVQLPLALPHLAQREDVTWLERQLPANDVLVDADFAFDFDRSETSKRTGFRLEDDTAQFVARLLL